MTAGQPRMTGPPVFTPLSGVLNPGLFAILSEADETCSVVSERSAAAYYIPSAQLGYSRKDIQYASVSSWGEAYRINCPFCGDTRKHLFFSHLAGARVLVKGRAGLLRFSDTLCVCHKAACHRENPAFRGWLKGLQLWTQPSLDFTACDSLHASSLKYGLCADVEDMLPHPTHPLMSGQTPDSVHEYLHSRRYDGQELQDRYGVGYCPPMAYTDDLSKPEGERRRYMKEGRLVIPIVQGRSLVGWQARLLRKAEKGEPKYLTSPNLTKNKVLYNLDTALLYNTVVLVEGVFDVWRIGDMAVCPFGHSLSPAQMLQMQTVFGQNGGCLIMLDSDANQEAFKLANRLHEAKVFPRGIVPVYTYDNKDPDDRSPDELRDLMTNAMRALVPCRHAAPVADLETLLQGFSELEDE